MDEIIFPNKISQELSRIVAHISGDGYIHIGKHKRSYKELISHPRKNKIRTKYYIRYVNKEPKLVKQFIRDIKKEFNRKVIILRKNEYEVDGKWIYEIIKYLGANKSNKWFIPQEIYHGNRENKIEWIKAFFDDEAHVSLYNKNITVGIVNKKGLVQIQEILKEFGIQSKFYGPYMNKKYYIYRICISGHIYLKKYNDLIGFYHPKKKTDLNKIIKIHKKYGDAGSFYKSNKYSYI